MRSIKYIVTTFVTSLIVACGGGGNSSSNSNTVNNTSAQKTYGVFRALKSKPLPLLAGSSQSQQTSNTMVIQRAYHRSIQMLNGKILIVGGDLINGSIPSAMVDSIGNVVIKGTVDIFDPTTENFVRSSASLSHVRAYQYPDSTYESFALVNLPDGKVAIIGNRSANMFSVKNDVYEIYDPITDTATAYTLTGGLVLNAVDAAFYIGNNNILIFDSNGLLLNLNFDPTDFTKNTLTTINVDKTLYGGSAVQTPNGDIYLIGGSPMEHSSDGVFYNASTTFIRKYNIVGNTWSVVANLATGRDSASALLLPNNKIGIYGGRSFTQNHTNNSTYLDSVEIFDYASNTVTASASLVGIRYGAATAYLQTGYALLAGGSNTGIPMSSQLIHNATLNFSGSTGDMTVPRMHPSAVALNNGLVLLTGGYGAAGTSETANTGEVFDPQAALYIGYQSETLVLGNTMQFTAKDSSGNTINATWTVDDPSIATIDNTGLLTTIKPGNVLVTANSVAYARIQILDK